MKTKILFVASAVLLLQAMSSCEKTSVDADAPLKFSTQTVEQQKASIEQSGLDLADKMNGLQQTPAYEALNYLSDGQLNAPALIAPLKRLRASLLKNDVKSLETFNNQMRVAANAGQDIWGTWIWNKSTQDFDRTFGAANKAVFYFPTSAMSTNDNGVVTINYTESNVKVPQVTPLQFYPKNLSVVFTIGGTEALNAQFNGEYQSDGTPTSIVQTLVIGAYNWTASLTNTTANVVANYTFKYNTQILLKFEAGVTGSFTASQLDAVNNNSNGPEDIVSGGFMSFQVMNVAVYGGITDMKGFMKEGNALKPDSIIHKEQYYTYTEYIYSKSYRDKQVSIFNKYLKFYGYFAEPKEKFAEVEFFTAEDTYTYNNWVYNPTTQNYTIVPVIITDYYVQPRLVMSDGSKEGDFAKFASESFGAAIDKFKTMLPK